MNYGIKDFIDLKDCDDIDITGVEIDEENGIKPLNSKRSILLCFALNVAKGCILKVYILEA